ncbi:hypothetical protein BU17DRAFT_69104 [Hysterangium stoloniferum]|nr:hypothetical protein BU17DRAFT_69104 [Hysterangium stoloniferum]
MKRSFMRDASPGVSDVSAACHGTVHTSAPVATLTLSSNFSSAQDLDQDVEMADAFEMPFEAYLRPAGLPTWLTDYGYFCFPVNFRFFLYKEWIRHIDWASGPIFRFSHEVVRSFIPTSSCQISQPPDHFKVFSGASYLPNWEFSTSSVESLGLPETSLVRNIDQVVTKQSNPSIMRMTSLVSRGQEALDRILPVSAKSSFSLQ